MVKTTTHIKPLMVLTPSNSRGLEEYESKVASFEPVGNSDKLVTSCNEVNHERRDTQAERQGFTESMETIFEGAEGETWTQSNCWRC